LQEIIPGKIMVFSAVMLRLSFLSRVAFICNVCLVLVWLLHYLPPIPSESVVSTIIIAGLALSFVMNAVVNVAYAVVLIRRKPLRELVPVWLAVINFLFLIFQLYLVL
jgi:hypothetical protein